MSQHELLKYLKNKHPGKFTAKQLIEYTGLRMQSVFNSLRVMRERGEISYDLTERAGGKPVRVYYYKSDSLEKKENLFELTQKHRDLNSEDVQYFFSLENDLAILKEQVKEIVLRMECCSSRPFDKYLRKAHVEALWDEVKEILLKI